MYGGASLSMYHLLDLLLWSQSKVFTFRPVSDEFQDLWTIRVSIQACCGQHKSLTPGSTSGMMCGKEFTAEHPAWHWQLGHQEELCFSYHHSWASLNPFLSCHYFFFSWHIAQFGSFVSLTPEPLGSSSSISWVILPGYILPETPGRTILSGCSVQFIFNILSWPDWPKGSCMNPFKFAQNLVVVQEYI